MPVNSLSNFGTFQEEGSLAQGDPWAQPTDTGTRHRGKQFGVPFQPKGTGRDAMIDKTTVLSVPGDRYIEPYSLTKDLGKRSSIHGKAFIPVGGTKSLGGSGTIHGLFGRAQDLFVTEPVAQSNKSTDKNAGGKRNIYVAPPKKGTYGFPTQDRTIGGTRLESFPDEYCRGRIVERAEKQRARERIGKPFVAMGRTNRGITPMPTYSGPTTPPVAHTRARSTEPQGSIHNGRCVGIHNGRSWKAPNPSPKGPGYGTLSKLVYIPCASVPPPKPKTTPSGAFRPPGGYHARQSMWSPNPYAFAARPPPNNDMSLLG